MKLTKTITILLALLLLTLTGCQLVEKRPCQPDLSGIDRIVEEEIEKSNIPGAVVLTGQGNKVLYWKAFGHEVNEPFQEKMSKNTIFDLASVTKPVATATSILILVDRGKIKLDDYAGKYLPAFACNDKEEVRIRHLLTHTSGLPAYTNADELKNAFGTPCPDKVIDKICNLKALSKPGEEFRYSCLGYITLARIVEIVSGDNIDDFSRENIFAPLRMKQTTYNPPASKEKNIAATQIVEEQLLRGTVHDPLARLMGGVSGNAGLFSTANDLSTYCRMLFNSGKWKRTKVLSPESVRLLTTVQSHDRAYGFDVNSSYSWVKGSYAPENAFCHTGYTGTSIVCDPESKVYVIILTNRAHPHDKGTSKPIRTKIADIVFSAYK
ncbi:MAG: serine hydrolase [Phycisphaerae bacterium]|nr:beta-lactamase family protein [Phycisphaerae bacterium]NIP51234.1 beta-lactamase family protein [Phycisphaerae bacterium]NIS50440.1 beta-lactamase family protein [Phycisphaerae bacterium]NIU08175.1 beta-lactamase family protein [Phycisphaerae bacterium]NIU54946.1 serine hydrolase [Phycisphaerae bacterium]